MQRPDNAERARIRIGHQAHTLAAIDSTMRALQHHGNFHHSSLGHGGWCTIPACVEDHHRLMRHHYRMAGETLRSVRHGEMPLVLAAQQNILSGHPQGMIASIENQVMAHITDNHADEEAHRRVSKENDPYYKRNKEQLKAYQLAYYYKNRERIKKAQHGYYLKNKSKTNQGL